MIFDKNTFWDSKHTYHPPLTSEDVLFAERLLNVRLPTLLVDLLKIKNGGATQSFAYRMNQVTSWADDHVPFDELNGIVLQPHSQTILNLCWPPETTIEWGVPERQVLLSGDGHYWITLDYRQSEIPSVRWVNTECDEDIHVADTFETFIYGLISSDEIWDKD